MEKLSKKTPSAEEVLRRILELEKDQAHIQKEISKLVLSGNWPKRDHKISNSAISLHRPHLKVIGAALDSGVSLFPEVNRETDCHVMGRLAMKLTETQYLNIMQSMGQAIHIFDLKHRIIFWSPTAESLFGFTPAEACGKTPTELLVQPTEADYLLERTVCGDSLSGEFPVTTKKGENFAIICTYTPFRDGNKKLIGGMCVSTDARPFKIMKPQLSVAATTRSDSQQSLQTSIASKISNLASKVKLKMKIDHRGGSEVAASDDSEDALQSEASTPGGHRGLSPYGVFISTGTEEHFTRSFTRNSGDQSENKPGICKILSSKAEEWKGKTRSVWPWKENEREVVSLDAKLGYFGWQRLSVNQGPEAEPQISSAKLACQICAETTNIEAPGLWLSTVRVNSTSNTSSSDRTESHPIVKVEKETDGMDYEILWEDLITKGQIGQGSCGTVYHGLWHGSDIAIKLFMYQEFSDDVMVSFKQEVSLMKRLRHPNILLFMGAVTSRQHLCIVTEFLPRLVP